MVYEQIICVSVKLNLSPWGVLIVLLHSPLVDFGLVHDLVVVTGVKHRQPSVITLGLEFDNHQWRIVPVGRSVGVAVGHSSGG